MHELQKRLNDHPYAEKSGSVFYSEQHTLKPGPYYFLGLNPGGEPNPNAPNEYLKNSLCPQGNAYYDEEWPPHPRGRAPLQLRVKAFLSSLEFPDVEYHEPEQCEPDTDQKKFIKSVCSANLCFLRSKSVKDLEQEYKKGIANCIDWDIQEYIINKIVRPSLIIVNGKQGYWLLKAKLQGLTKEGELATGNYRNGKKRSGVEYAFFGEDKLLVGIPHLSRNCFVYCTALKNPDWRENGFQQLREYCAAVTKRRKSGLPAWEFSEPS